MNFRGLTGNCQDTNEFEGILRSHTANIEDGKETSKFTPLFHLDMYKLERMAILRPRATTNIGK